MNAAHNWRQAVICTKASGVRVLFGVFDSLREAEETAARLRQLGIPATVEPARAGLTVPGATVRNAADEQSVGNVAREGR